MPPRLTTPYSERRRAVAIAIGASRGRRVAELRITYIGSLGRLNTMRRFLEIASLAGCGIILLFWLIGLVFDIGMDLHLFGKLYCEIDCGAGRMEFSMTRSYGDPFIVRCGGDYKSGSTKGNDFDPKTTLYLEPVSGHAPIFGTLAFKHEKVFLSMDDFDNWYAYIDVPYWLLFLFFAIFPTLTTVKAIKKPRNYNKQA